MNDVAPQLLPISVLESPYDHPMSDPKDGNRKVVGVPVAVVPEGFRIESLKTFFEEYRRKPATRTGVVEFHSDLSFVAFVNRYKDAKQTVIFIDNQKKNRTVITAIFDYHPEGSVITDTGAGEFRAVFETWGTSAVPEIIRTAAVPHFWGKAP